jgi:signal transduction histidine kinase
MPEDSPKLGDAKQSSSPLTVDHPSLRKNIFVSAGRTTVKIRRIAQNLLLNSVKYTRHGGITMTWGVSAPNDAKRWLLTIQDTGPGFHTKSGQPLAAALAPGSESLPPSVPSISRPSPNVLGEFSVQSDSTRSPRGDAGEGIGLSIVKRLCEMLDAKIEMQSV